MYASDYDNKATRCGGAVSVFTRIILVQAEHVRQGLDALATQRGSIAIVVIRARQPRSLTLAPPLRERGDVRRLAGLVRRPPLLLQGRRKRGTGGAVEEVQRYLRVGLLARSSSGRPSDGNETRT